MPTRAGGRHHRDGIVEAETYQRLWTQLHLLTLRDGVSSCTRSGASRGSNGRALATPKDATQDCAYSGSTSDFLGSVFTGFVGLLRPGVGSNLVGLSVVADLLKTQHQRGPAGVVRGGMRFHYASVDFRARRDHRLVINSNIRVECAVPGVVLMAGFGTQALNRPHPENRACRHRDLLRRRRQSWWAAGVLGRSLSPSRIGAVIGRR